MHVVLPKCPKAKYTYREQTQAGDNKMAVKRYWISTYFLFSNRSAVQLLIQCSSLPSWQAKQIRLVVCINKDQSFEWGQVGRQECCAKLRQPANNNRINLRDGRQQGWMVLWAQKRLLKENCWATNQTAVCSAFKVCSTRSQETFSEGKKKSPAIFVSEKV